MNIRKSSVFLYSACMIVLILDTRTAIHGAAEGIAICIKSLIPSLFPFFIFSALLTASLAGQPVKLLRSIAKICRIPKGAESLLAIGFLGGYPVGAQNVAFSWKKGYLNTDDALRMVTFCSNAGPAFIFGFLGQMCDQPVMPWILWMIHILSALIVGFLLPAGAENPAHIPNAKGITLSDAMDSSLMVMGRVCGWVILFRILLEFLKTWIFWRFPVTVQVFITGILELSNGCMMLQSLPSDGLRLILASTFLGFGGICVFLQTRSTTQGLSLSLYLPGKLLQGTISFLLSYVAQTFLIAHNSVHFSPYLVGIVFLSTVLSAVILRKIEKPVAFFRELLYNVKSCEKRRTQCCFGRKSNVPAPTASTVPN